MQTKTITVIDTPSPGTLLTRPGGDVDANVTATLQPDSLDLLEEAIGDEQRLVHLAQSQPRQRPFSRHTDFHRLKNTGRDTGRTYVCLSCRDPRWRDEKGRQAPLERLMPKLPRGGGPTFYTHAAHRLNSIKTFNNLLSEAERGR